MIEPNVIDFDSSYLKIKCNKTKEIFNIVKKILRKQFIKNINKADSNKLFDCHVL